MINNEIKMDFPFEWSDGIAQTKPRVNRLLKAIINGNVEEMNRYFDRGATIEGMDETTFRLVIAKVIKSYPNRYEIVKCLFDHGFNCLRTKDGKEPRYDDSCGLTSGGYSVGLFALAYFNNDIRLCHLLIDHGFFEMSSTIRNNEYTSDGSTIRVRLLKQNNIDWKMIMYAMSQSLPKDEIVYWLAKSSSRERAKEMMADFRVERSGFLLDTCRYAIIKPPTLEKEKFFNRKKVQDQNTLILSDYKERVKAQEMFIQKYYGKETWHRICRNKTDYKKWVEYNNRLCGTEFMENVFALKEKKEV